MEEYMFRTKSKEADEHRAHTKEIEDLLGAYQAAGSIQKAENFIDDLEIALEQFKIFALKHPSLVPSTLNFIDKLQRSQTAYFINKKVNESGGGKNRGHWDIGAVLRKELGEPLKSTPDQRLKEALSHNTLKEYKIKVEGVTSMEMSDSDRSACISRLENALHQMEMTNDLEEVLHARRIKEDKERENDRYKKIIILEGIYDICDDRNKKPEAALNLARSLLNQLKLEKNDKKAENQAAKIYQLYQKHEKSNVLAFNMMVLRLVHSMNVKHVYPGDPVVLQEDALDNIFKYQNNQEISTQGKILQDLYMLLKNTNKKEEMLDRFINLTKNEFIDVDSNKKLLSTIKNSDFRRAVAGRMVDLAKNGDQRCRELLEASNNKKLLLIKILATPISRLGISNSFFGWGTTSHRVLKKGRQSVVEQIRQEEGKIYGTKK
jgi:hypothetical protein